MKRIIFLLLIFCVLEVQAQFNSKLWVFGSRGWNLDSASLDTGLFRNYGSNLVNFNGTTLSLNRKFKALSLLWNAVNITSQDGKIILYSNGNKVFNSNHELIDNADSLNYNSFWNSSIGDRSYFGCQLIGSYPRSLMAFQSPANPNQYYLVSTIMNYDSLAQTQWLRFHRVVYSIIDMSLNGGRGKMIVKEKLLLNGDFSHALSACRHANGKDWWIVSRGYQDTNCYYFYKLDKDGIRYDHKQCIGINYRMKYIVGENDSLTLSYGSAFSPDGKKFAILSYKGLELFDFNRCTGTFSNFKFSPYPYGDTVANYTLFEGVGAPCFSPNNQLVYVDYARRLYQFDVSSSNFQSSGIRVATWDGFLDHLNNDPKLVGFQTTFNTMQLAANGKIYVGNGEEARYMTEIEFPDKRGIACNVRQHTYRLLTYMGGVPYYPNYNLGADTCAGSGIAQIEDMKIEVFPNPAFDFVSVSLPTTVIPANAGISLTMTNLLGQSFSPLVIPAHSGISLDVKYLPEGIYLLHIRDKNDVLLKTERMVIVR